MSSTSTSADATTESSGAVGVPMAFEVTTLPVADVDRAKAFYQSLGWRLDIDFKPTENSRGVQFTPPGSRLRSSSEGHEDDDGPLQGLILVVKDIESARQDLIGRGADVSEIWHTEPGKGRAARPRPRAPLVLQPREPSPTPTATPGSSRKSRNGSQAR